MKTKKINILRETVLRSKYSKLLHKNCSEVKSEVQTENLIILHHKLI